MWHILVVFIVIYFRFIVWSSLVAILIWTEIWSTWPSKGGCYSIKRVIDEHSVDIFGLTLSQIVRRRGIIRTWFIVYWWWLFIGPITAVFVCRWQRRGIISGSVWGEIGRRCEWRWFEERILQFISKHNLILKIIFKNKLSWLNCIMFIFTYLVNTKSNEFIYITRFDIIQFSYCYNRLVLCQKRSNLGPIDSRNSLANPLHSNTRRSNLSLRKGLLWKTDWEVNQMSEEPSRNLYNYLYSNHKQSYEREGWSMKNWLII